MPEMGVKYKLICSAGQHWPHYSNWSIINRHCGLATMLKLNYPGSTISPTKEKEHSKMAIQMDQKITVDFDVPAKMRDGTTLRANIYRPSGAGQCPRSPTALPYSQYFH